MESRPTFQTETRPVGCDRDSNSPCSTYVKLQIRAVPYLCDTVLYFSSLASRRSKPVVRDGIRNRLDREEDLTVVGEAANGEESIRQVRRTYPDVVLLDVAMPGPGAVPVMEALRPR
jgi:hypothetical protein